MDKLRDVNLETQTYKHSSLCVLLDLYKSNDISQFALLTELEKTLSTHIFGDGYAKVTVFINQRKSGNNSNSFIFLVLPHKTEKSIKFEVYFDDLILQKINTYIFDQLIDIIENLFDSIAWDYTTYIKNLNHKEISVSDCILFLLKVSKSCFNAIPDFIKEKISSELSIDFTKVDKIIAMVEDGEPLNHIIENIQIDNVLPDSVVEYAQKFMPKDLSSNFSDKLYGVDKASINAYFDYLRSYTTFKQDPYPIFNIPDKVVYEDFDSNENDVLDNLDIFTESNNFKPKALKHAVNYLSEEQLGRMLSRIYRSLSSDPSIPQTENIKDLIDAFNPSELDKKEMRRRLRAAIDDVPAKRIKPFEDKAQELLYSNSQNKSDASDSAVAIGLQTILTSSLLLSAIIDSELRLLAK